MSRRRALAALLLIGPGAGAGCATYSSYTCPAPIGQIVRQDCEDYRVRYESLQASLQVSLGSVSVGGSMGRENLRDPSELVQVMMHQMLALCHDYNACRVPNAEFSRRRERMDRTFTAVMALAEQLRAPALERDERRRLLDRLWAALGAPTAAAPKDRDQAVAETEKAEQKERRNPFRRPNSFWLNSAYLPPRPQTPAGVPAPIWVQVGQSRDQPPKWVLVYLWGPVAEDDALALVSPEGQRMRCKLSNKRDQPLAKAVCKPEKGEAVPPLAGLEMRFTVGERGETITLGGPDLAALADPDAVWLAFQPLPIDAYQVRWERPTLMLITPVRQRLPVTARCRRDGQPVRHDGAAVLEGWAHINPYVRLHRRPIALPFAVPHGRAAGEPPLPLFTTAAGRWRCKIKLGLDVVRVVEFEIEADGRPVPHPRQCTQAGCLTSPWWLLETETRPHPQAPTPNPS